MKISKTDIISEVINSHPETFEIFMDKWLWCAGCSAANFETIEKWASAHWLSEKEIDEFVDDLNEALT